MLAPKKNQEPVKATPAVEEKSELTKPTKRTKSGTGSDLSCSFSNQRQQKQKKQNKIAKRIVDSGQPADCDRGCQGSCCDLYPFSCQADG